MQSEAETTDQSLYVKCVEKNSGKGGLSLTKATMELYERHALSASAGDQMSTLTDTHSYSKWLTEVVAV